VRERMEKEQDSGGHLLVSLLARVGVKARGLALAAVHKASPMTGSMAGRD